MELEKSVRRLREKFYAKVTITDGKMLMRKFNKNHDLVCKHIILCKNEDSTDQNDSDSDNEQNLQDDHVALMPKDDEKVKEIAQNLKVLPLTQKNLRMFDNAQNNRIPPEDHQFACQMCDNMWWRRVPIRKKVSRCRRCKKRYDPVPYDKLWGLAVFYCSTCDRNFSAQGQMGIPSPCRGCLASILPIRIIPPRRTERRRSRNHRAEGHGAEGHGVLPVRIIPPHRTERPWGRNQHSCLAEDCHNRREPHVPGTHCVHPRSRLRIGLPKVLYPSVEHVSTGSTVDTCVSQGSLLSNDIDDLILEDIEELTLEDLVENEGEDNESSN